MVFSGFRPVKEAVVDDPSLLVPGAYTGLPFRARRVPGHYW